MHRTATHSLHSFSFTPCFRWTPPFRMRVPPKNDALSSEKIAKQKSTLIIVVLALNQRAEATKHVFLSLTLFPGINQRLDDNGEGGHRNQSIIMEKTNGWFGFLHLDPDDEDTPVQTEHLILVPLLVCLCVILPSVFCSSTLKKSKSD